jgi:hypothetical protein
MRLYKEKIPVIAMDIVRVLIADKDIEAEDPREVEADIESVLKEYLRLDRDLTEKAKDRAEMVGGSRQDITRFKKVLADQRNIGLGAESVSYILDQLIAILMQSPHVDEIFADDADMRRKARKVLEKHMAAEEELDQEVRDKIKNIEEGSKTWDVEYARMMEQVKRKRGIT